MRLSFGSGASWMLVTSLALAAGCGDSEGAGGSGAGPGVTVGPGPSTTTGPSTTGNGPTSSSTGGGTCASCIAGSCAIPAASCDVGCQAWQACLAACAEGDLACVQTCHDGYAVPADVFNTYIACVCTSCAGECAAISPCQEKGCENADDPPELFETPPPRLSDTPLYADIAQKTLATGISPYVPEFPLWSDGADKQRYVKLPRCSSIDTSDPDHFVFPMGTSFWKEFTRDGVLIETRFIHKFGPGEDDWIFASYQWESSEMADAILLDQGVTDAKGTPHDIPAPAQCLNCHSKLDERILGFSAVQLSHQIAGSQTMATLAAAGRIPMSQAAGFPVPGNDVERAALGYLHGNCGNCHADGGVFVALKMRVLTTDTTVQETDLYETAVNVAPQNFSCMGCDLIEPGDPEASAIIIRMQARGDGQQMPPLVTTASELADQDGIDAVSAWIDSIMQ